jgi:catechol 2,3-dioxygenase
MMIQVVKVGHVMLRVRGLERALAFYEQLGLREVARSDFGEGTTVFLSAGGTHHDLALVEAAGVGKKGSSELHHVGLKIGDSLGELSSAKRQLEASGTPILMALDHRVSQGLYVRDPDGNLIELYVDAHETLWQNDPTLVAHSELLPL